MAETFKDWVRGKRSKLKLTQDDFAAALSVSQTTVSQWESGRNLPTLGNLSALAKLAGVPLASITHFADKDGAGLVASNDPTADLDPLALDILQLVAGRPEAEQAAILATVKALAENFDRGKREQPTGVGGTAARPDKG